MDLMHKTAAIAAILAGAAAFGGLFLYLRARAHSFKGGVRAANTAMIRGSASYKRLRILLLAATALLEIALFTAFGSAVLLAARPYIRDSVKAEERKRDIFLCLDVSYSIYSVNYDMVDSLEQVVAGLDGDRFGITIYNTSSVLYVPMTDDYQFVIDKLEELKEVFRKQKEYEELVEGHYYYSELDPEDMDRALELDEELSYLLDATLVRNTTRGSSLIGEGLATCLYSFPRLDSSDRTRVIIMVTDNCDSSKGKPIIDLSGAMDLCREYGIRVYGVWPKTNDLLDLSESEYAANGEDFRAQIGKTDGAFYVTSAEVPVSDIVDSIQEQEAKAVSDVVISRMIDQPQPLALVLFISLLISGVLGAFLFL